MSSASWALAKSGGTARLPRTARRAPEGPLRAGRRLAGSGLARRRAAWDITVPAREAAGAQRLPGKQAQGQRAGTAGGDLGSAPPRPFPGPPEPGTAAGAGTPGDPTPHRARRPLPPRSTSGVFRWTPASADWSGLPSRDADAGLGRLFPPPSPPAPHAEVAGAESRFPRQPPRAVGTHQARGQSGPGVDCPESILSGEGEVSRHHLPVGRQRKPCGQGTSVMVRWRRRS